MKDVADEFGEEDTPRSQFESVNLSDKQLNDLYADIRGKSYETYVDGHKVYYKRVTMSTNVNITVVSVVKTVWVYAAGDGWTKIEDHEPMGFSTTLRPWTEPSGEQVDKFDVVVLVHREGLAVPQGPGKKSRSWRAYLALDGAGEAS